MAPKIPPSLLHASQLSDTFVPAPGNYISRVTLSGTGLTLGALGLVPYFAQRPKAVLSRRVLLGFSTVGSTCLGLVGAVCEDDKAPSWATVECVPPTCRGHRVRRALSARRATALPLTHRALVEQRARSFDYIKRVHLGDAHWLSTVALGPQEQSMHKVVDSTQGESCSQLTCGRPPAQTPSLIQLSGAQCCDGFTWASASVRSSSCRVGRRLSRRRVERV